jgi:hypothetical protein
MTAFQKEVLFYVFTGFFVLIGVGSLLALMGFVKGTDKAFRRWAVGGFAGAVALAVGGLFRLWFLAPPAHITVTLVPPGDPPAVLALDKGGTFSYDEVIDEGKGTVATRAGTLVPVLGEGGAWQVRLPGSIVDKAVRLEFEDTGGTVWVAGPFYPNVIQQRMRSGQKAATRPVASSPSSSLLMPVVSAAEHRPDVAEQQQATVRFNNYARPIGDHSGRPYYQWRVFVDEPPDILDTIRQVDYVMHATFPDPFRTSRDRQHHFELVTSGWGTFRIVITVHFTNGTEAKTSYQLDFQKGWPSPPTPPASLERRPPGSTDLFAGRWTLDRARSQMGPYDEVAQEVLELAVPGSALRSSWWRKLKTGKTQTGTSDLPCDGSGHVSAGFIMQCQVVARDEVHSFVKTPGHKPPVLYSVRRVEGGVMTVWTYSDPLHTRRVSC